MEKKIMEKIKFFEKRSFPKKTCEKKSFRKNKVNFQQKLKKS